LAEKVRNVYKRTVIPVDSVTTLSILQPHLFILPHLHILNSSTEATSTATMQLSQILALAFATTAMATVYNDNIVIPASVEGPKNAVAVDAAEFGTAVTGASAKLRAKGLEARASQQTSCEHANFQGACRTVGGINAGTCCKSLCPGFKAESKSIYSNRCLIRENRQHQRYLERCHLVH
jgi:hypothetical protein